MSDKLEATVRRRDGLSIIQFKGDMTTFAEDVVHDVFREATRDSRRNLALDFSACEYINSAGIAVIIGIVTEARRQGWRIFVFGLSTHYQKIFRMVGLGDYIEMCASEDEALQRAKPPGA